MKTDDSRRIRPGDTFIAVRGAAQDGARYIPAALAAGARCILSENPPPPGLPPGVAWETVPDACEQADNPSESLPVFAVTGTNGKTTVANLMRWLLTEGGIPCGLLSTIENDVHPLPAGPDGRFGSGFGTPAHNTTPGPFELQDALRAMLANRCRAAAMEVSSHALAQHRTDGTRFRAAVFTNLTQDHLDYHATLEDYFAAKRRLFHDPATPLPPPEVAVLCVDDPYGARLAAEVRAASPQRVCLTYGFGAGADVRLGQLRVSPTGSAFTLHAPYLEAPLSIETRLLGRHNALNLAAALTAVCVGANLPATRLAETLRAVPPVRGRLEPVAAPDSPAAFFVDYAHTPDAIENVARTLRELTRGRLFIVFGAGGDRDRAKRPRMGEAAARFGDEIIVTSDNPRSEQPDAIIRDILAGIPAGVHPHVEPDRAAAIRLARRLAQSPDDTVLIAGKGHETYQIVGSRTLSFDDREAVRAGEPPVVMRAGGVNRPLKASAAKHSQ